MYDIITFGSASQDIFVKSEEFKVLRDLPNGSEGGDFATGQGICLPFGSKIDAKDFIFTSGGGGTNTAAAFAKQGFKVAVCCAIGEDASGLEIVRELKKLKIDTRFLVKKNEKKTNCSVVVSGENGERSILVYRGASELLCLPTGRQLSKLRKTKWFYLAPLSGEMTQAFAKLVDFAVEHKIKVAVNPSKQQLSLPESQLKSILQKVNILFLNQEEAAFLTKISFEKEAEIFKKMQELCSGIVVMTKGKDGVIVSDGKCLYSAAADAESKVVDTTGAGDSFASGFVSEFIRTKGDIEKSIQLGLANSAANLTEIGAKTGVLEKQADFKRLSVQKQNI